MVFLCHLPSSRWGRGEIYSSENCSLSSNEKFPAIIFLHINATFILSDSYVVDEIGKKERIFLWLALPTLSLISFRFMFYFLINGTDCNLIRRKWEQFHVKMTSEKELYVEINFIYLRRWMLSRKRRKKFYFRST